MAPVIDMCLPPEDLSICFGGGDFVETGEILFDLFTRRGGLRPHERVLDVGCGVGRAARPLIGYLDAGTYEGFDTFPHGVDWCREHITPDHPNFRFRTLDVYNTTYNPMSEVRAADLVFPYEDRSFDFVMLNSVFTHMLPEDVDGYLYEISRVLDHGGRAFITWFLINDESRAGMEAGIAEPTFPHKYGLFHLQFQEEPEVAVGYDERFVLKNYARHGFDVSDIIPGYWCGRTAVQHQDAVIARKA